MNTGNLARLIPIDPELKQIKDSLFQRVWKVKCSLQSIFDGPVLYFSNSQISVNSERTQAIGKEALICHRRTGYTEYLTDFSLNYRNKQFMFWKE